MTQMIDVNCDAGKWTVLATATANGPIQLCNKNPRISALVRIGASVLAADALTAPCSLLQPAETRSFTVVTGDVLMAAPQSAPKGAAITVNVFKD